MIAVDEASAPRRGSSRTTALPPARRGASRRRISESYTVTPQRSPSSSATSATIVTASTAASSALRSQPADVVGSRSGAAMSRPASSRHTTSRSCSMRYWLLIGRPSAFGRRPVDLADVVVGQVVAHRLELGAEPERTAGAQPGVAEAAAPQRDHEALRGEHVGIHEQVACRRRRRTCTCPGRAVRGGARRPEEARCAPRRCATTSRVDLPATGRGLDREVGRARLAEIDAARERRDSVVDRERRRDPARERRGEMRRAAPAVRRRASTMSTTR